MKLTVETIEVVSGKTINPAWKKDMIVVNGQYYSSTIPFHNTNGKVFDGVVGETYDVVVNGSNWIGIK